MQRLTPEDCAAISGCLPYTALALIKALGAVPACTLINERPGITIVIPKHPNANASGAKRWAELAALIGDPAMQILAATWGGEPFSVPVCKKAREELRARRIRGHWDRLVNGEGLSGRQAVYEIGLLEAPITSRAIELICGRADEGHGGHGPVQAGLF
ncbi:MAG: hypothetical protein AW12_00854 [Candidatus Accumulibacter sp. BA-94]|uniref:hypothetical protein n=1 Tax=Accumulibacter sp. TaxID=2053492 RepID=UPI00044E2B8D|nr:hypothetical protein [Accumulibacter sp.]EXI92111.1 MAG: hypothetical protein AW12_00854 [Candidatus Accumulibacter sp. BA-94]HRD86798.1 hypothetical protein [Accumulibacter sp.]